MKLEDLVPGPFTLIYRSSAGIMNERFLRVADEAFLEIAGSERLAASQVKQTLCSAGKATL